MSTCLRGIDQRFPPRNSVSGGRQTLRIDDELVRSVPDEEVLTSVGASQLQFGPASEFFRCCNTAMDTGAPPSIRAQGRSFETNWRCWDPGSPHWLCPAQLSWLVQPSACARDGGNRHRGDRPRDCRGRILPIVHHATLCRLQPRPCQQTARAAIGEGCTPVRGLDEDIPSHSSANAKHIRGQVSAGARDPLRAACALVDTPEDSCRVANERSKERGGLRLPNTRFYLDINKLARAANRDCNSLHACLACALPVGTWRSLVAHLHGVQGVASSNLAVPTNLPIYM